MKKNLFLLGAALSFQAYAAEPALMLQVGRGGDIEMAGLGLRLGPVWARQWGRFDLAAHPEFQINRFRWRDGPSPGPGALWQAGATAMFNATYGEGEIRPYVELGLGVNYLTRTALGDDRYGMRFQFGEHLGVGLASRGGFFAGLRVSHYSNGGLDSPNNGLTAGQVVLGTRF